MGGWAEVFLSIGLDLVIAATTPLKHYHKHIFCILIVYLSLPLDSKDSIMTVGYARTSTIDQIAGLEAQLTELKTAGCQKIYQEQVSSIGKRPELENALDFVREGDTFVVTKLDRLARSMADLMTILKGLSNKKVAVRILNLGLDTQTPTGKLIFNVLGSVAQFEREIMLERQREGIAKAKADKKYKGRKPLKESIQKEVLRLAQERLPKAAIAKELSIGQASVYRILAAGREK